MPEVIKDIKCPSYYTLKGEDDVLWRSNGL
jgi:hypothetical protein